MKFNQPPLFSILLLALVAVGTIFFLPHLNKAKAAAPQTWFVRADGGTRYDANVPTGQCDGLADAPYPGTGVNQHCAFKDFRYMWDDDSGLVGAGAWVIAGGDTVVIRGCSALPTATNPANPDCRLGWDGPWGSTSDNWCYGVGSYTCYNPPIPAGTPTNHTKILGACAYGTYNCTPINNNYPYGATNETQLFGGFGLTWTFNLSGAQNVDVEGIELTTHNGQCVRGGAPAYPRWCSNNQPLDDFAQNGFLTDNTTANVTLQDVYIHGFNSAGLYGPIGGAITATRVFVGFNGFAGWNFADTNDTPDAPGSSIRASYVTMIGNGCYEQYPIVNSTFPAQTCYDDLSQGFGDAWSGQDTPLDTLTCDHCVQEYNTKDGFIGPHTQIKHLTITNSKSIGNMGEQWKFGTDVNSTVVFQNNVTAGDSYRMTSALPGAAQNFSISSGLPGSYLSDFGRAGGDIFSIIVQPGATLQFSGNTMLLASQTGIDFNCGLVNHAGSVTGGGTCGAVPIVWTNNVFLGYINPDCGSCGGLQPGLWYESDSSINFTSSHNLEFGIRNGDPCGGSIICSDPLLGGEPPQSFGNQSAFDHLTYIPQVGSPLIGAGIAISGLTTDYLNAVRGNPPTIGAFEVAGSGTQPPPDTTPPTTSVTSPANNATVSGIVNVTATASDNIGVTQVQLYIDGSLKGTDASSPYSFSLDMTSLTNGTHTIVSKASDAAGNIGSSGNITVTVSNTTSDTTAPSTPTNLSVANVTSSSIALSWTASTDNIGVAGYNIYRGGVKIGTSTTTSYTNTGLTASTTYTYTVSAYDAAGNTSAQSGGVNGATSSGVVGNPTGPSGYVFCANEGSTCSFLGTASVAFGANANFIYLDLTNGTLCSNTIFGDPIFGVVKACFIKLATDVTPPTTSITSPVNNASVSGTISISASASDNIGVTSVALYVDGSIVGTDNASPYTFSLNTTSLSNANHTLSTKAYDAAGNIGTSGNVTIAVANNVVATPTISSVAVTNITNSSALTSWVTNVPATRKVNYGTTAGSLSSSVSSSVLTTSGGPLLSGLGRGKTYFYQVLSTNASGLTASSSVSSFTTAPKPGRVKNLSATNGSVILNWDSPDGTYASIQIVRRTDRYSIDPIADASSVIATLPSSATTYHDTAVAPGTTYYYSVFSVDSSDIASDPADIAFTPVSTTTGGSGSTGGGAGAGGGVTTIPAPTYAITSVSLSGVTATGATITVTTHAPESVVIKYGITTLYGATTPASPSGITSSFTLANLTPNTVYDFIVVATPTGGTSITSQNYTLKTLVPPVVPTSPPAFTQNLAYGDSGSQVTLLQTILHVQGFLPETVASTGYFGIQTEHALLLFQSAHYLNKSGFVDVQTEALLNKIVATGGAVTTAPVAGGTTTNVPGGTLTQNLAPGSIGSEVTILQHILTNDGDYTAGIFSTFYGTLTQTAVQKFQVKYGIATYGNPNTTGYGAVGPKTRAKLNSL